MPKGRKNSEGGSRGSTLPNKRQKTNDENIVQQSTEIPVVAKTAPDDDWQVNKPLSACLGYLQEKSHLTDVTFEFPEDDPVVKLDAHKLILAARSPVFEAMFFGLAGQLDQGPIKVSDANSKAFGEMLKFIYTDDVPMTDTVEVLNLLRLSHKYRIHSLVNACCSYLEDNLACEDVLIVLEVAMFLELTMLKQRCLIYIDGHTGPVFLSDHFKSINVNTLLEIVKRNSLTGISELMLYRSCILWARAQCCHRCISSTSENMRLVLDMVLKEIRFPLLDAEDIADEVSGEGILTDKELLDIFLEHSSKYETAGASKPRASYSSARYVTTVIPVKTEPMPITRKETVKIRASQDVFLTTFVWDKIRPRNTNTDLRLDYVKGKITVDDGENKMDCTEFSLGIKDNNEVTVDLKKSILLKKAVEYIVSIDLTFSNSTIESFRVFMVPKTLTLVNGAEVAWSSEHTNSIPVNRVLFYPWT